jgi:hypothetical protein
MAGVAIFSLLQLTFILTLNIRLFPITSTVLVLPLVPGFFWDRLGRTWWCQWMTTTFKCAPAVFCAVVLGFDLPMHQQQRQAWRQHLSSATTTSSTTAAAAPPLIRVARRLRTGGCKVVQFALAISIIAPMVAWNLKQLKVIKRVPESVGPWPLKQWSLLVGIGQTWDMFAPTVKKDDTWFAMPALLRDGSQLDVWPIIQTTEYTTPEAVLLRGHAKLRTLANPFAAGKGMKHDHYPSERWTQYMFVLERDKQCVSSGRCLRIGKYVCRQWNQMMKQHGLKPKELLGFKLVATTQRTVKGDCPGCTKELDPTAKVVWRHVCFLPPKQENIDVSSPGNTSPDFNPFPPNISEGWAQALLAKDSPARIRSTVPAAESLEEQVAEA